MRDTCSGSSAETHLSHHGARAFEFDLKQMSCAHRTCNIVFFVLRKYFILYFSHGYAFHYFNSNAGFQLPNLISTKVLEEEDGNSSEDKSFEAVTPEHEAPDNDDNEESQTPLEKHRRILEEVDGELEMEDVAPPSDVEVTTKCEPEQNGTNIMASDQRSSVVGPPLPVDGPPSPPPLPSSPPPVPPPPPAPIPQSAQMQQKLQMASDPNGPHPPRAAYVCIFCSCARDCGNIYHGLNGYFFPSFFRTFKVNSLILFQSTQVT